MEGILPRHRIALFASGGGTNVQRICDYFAGSADIRPTVIFCNNPKAYVIERAKRLGIPCILINRTMLNDPDTMLPLLHQYGADYLVLAGFLALLPSYLIQAYPDHIVNIHPALLPKYGGKGMYGMNVHEAVVANKEKESGITIHLVNEEYDRGKPLFQARCQVDPSDNAEDVAAKIHELEQRHFPEVILTWILDNEKSEKQTQTL